MAVVLETMSHTTYASRTNTPVTAPTGITDGDYLLLIAITGASTAPAVTLPAGFAGVPGPTWPQSTVWLGFNVKLYVAYKIASSESGSYTFTHTTAASQGVMMRFSGVDTTTPHDANATINNGSGTTTTALGLTTVTDNAAVVYIGQDWGDTTNALHAADQGRRRRSPRTSTPPTPSRRSSTSLMA